MGKVWMIFIFLSCTLWLKAQKIEVKEEKDLLGGANNPVLTVMIYKTDVATVESAWKSKMKDYNAKVAGKENIFADNATIKAMSDNTVDVYAAIKKNNEDVKFTVAFDIGGTFVSSTTKPLEYKVAEIIVRNFAIELSKKSVGEKLLKEKGKQKEYEKNLSDLVKRREKLEKNIEEYNNEITKAEKEIDYNKVGQEKLTKQIEEQKTIVEETQKNLGDIK